MLLTFRWPTLLHEPTFSAPLLDVELFPSMVRFSEREDALILQADPSESSNWAEKLLMSKRHVFHYSRTINQLESRRNTLLSSSTKSRVPRWTTNPPCVARIISNTFVHMMKTHSLVLGRGSKCDVCLWPEFPSLVLSRRACLLKLKQDGHLWAKNTGRNVVWVDTLPVDAGKSVMLPHVCVLQIGPVKLVVETNFNFVSQLCNI